MLSVAAVVVCAVLVVGGLTVSRVLTARPGPGAARTALDAASSATLPAGPGGPGGWFNALLTEVARFPASTPATAGGGQLPGSYGMRGNSAGLSRMP